MKNLTLMIVLTASILMMSCGKKKLETLDLRWGGELITYQDQFPLITYTRWMWDFQDVDVFSASINIYHPGNIIPDGQKNRLFAIHEGGTREECVNIFSDGNTHAFYWEKSSDVAKIYVGEKGNLEYLGNIEFGTPFSYSIVLSDTAYDLSIEGLGTKVFDRTDVQPYQTVLVSCLGSALPEGKLIKIHYGEIQTTTYGAHGNVKEHQVIRREDQLKPKCSNEDKASVPDNC